MKVTTAAAELLAHLQTVTRVASTRSAVQALSGVQLDASGGRVELRATDMEVGLRVPLEAQVEREGMVVLPGRLLLDVARTLRGDVVLELRPTEQDVEVTAAGATFHIRTLRAEDFPPFPEPPSENRVGLPARAFVETIARVERSASRDETRPILTGVLVAVSGKQTVEKSQSVFVRSSPASRPTSRRARWRSSSASPATPTRSRSRCARTRSCSRWGATS